MTDSLATQVIEKFTTLGNTVALAESCTGGLIAHRLTNVSGASKVFLGGVVCYSNQIKESLLHVPHMVLQSDGAVSAACATAMVRGIQRLMGASHCAAVTGIAGPTGGSATKPVGTVFIATLCENKLQCQEYHFNASREEFKNHCADEILKRFLSA